MKLSKKILIPIRDRLGPGARRQAEMLRVSLAYMACGGGRFPRECNICGYKGRFFPAGFPSGLTLRLDAGCPSCGALERHRLLKLWTDANANLFQNKEVLHFAPEAAIRRFISPVAGRYTAADIDPDRSVDRVLDLEAIAAPDGSYDLVVCSHVLEHVNDEKAMPELYRILRPKGALLVMVPIIEAWRETYENAAAQTPQKRLLHFDQNDHIRFYGADIEERLKKAGFDVSAFTACEPEVSRYGLIRGERLFICRKS